ARVEPHPAQELVSRVVEDDEVVADVHVAVPVDPLGPDVVAITIERCLKLGHEAQYTQDARAARRRALHRGAGAAPPGRPARARPPGKIGLAALDFSTGTLVLTEAGTKRRAAIHLVRGEEGVRAHDPGGLELHGADLAAFRAALVAESHTLKRSLTDPRLFSGIGNAYSDEIL